MQSSARLDTFWGVYKDLYDLVGRWAKKVKHAQFCYFLMCRVGAPDMCCMCCRDDCSARDIACAVEAVA